MRHNYWLDWKIRKGLATRGRVGAGPFNPKGLLSGFLYKIYYKKRDPGLTDLQIFKQSAGGTVGVIGKTNGE